MANAIVIRRGRGRGRQSGMTGPLRRLAAPLALVLAALAAPVPAQQAAEPPAAQARERLPAAVTTRHALALPEGTLEVEATAGAIVLEGAGGAPEAEIAYVAYTLPAADPATRPVTFAVNGGPGAASAYLNIGAIGPWRLPMDPGGPVPSQDVTLVPNAETWLPFTDLVFVDPVGTGFSRLIEPDDAQARALPRHRGRRRGHGAGRAALAGRERPGRVAALLRRRELRRLPRAAGRRGAARGRGAGARRAHSGVAGARLRLVDPGRAYAVAGGGAAAVARRRRDGGRGPVLGGRAGGGRGLCGGRLRDRPAARRRRRRGGRADRRAGDGADRARPRGGGGDRGPRRRRRLRARGRPRRRAADERLRRGGARGRAAAGAAARRRPGARRDDGAADRGDAGALPRHAAAGCRTGATSS